MRNDHCVDVTNFKREYTEGSTWSTTTMKRFTEVRDNSVHRVSWQFGLLKDDSVQPSCFYRTGVIEWAFPHSETPHPRRSHSRLTMEWIFPRGSLTLHAASYRVRLPHHSDIHSPLSMMYTMPHRYVKVLLTFRVEIHEYLTQNTCFVFLDIKFCNTGILCSALEMKYNFYITWLWCGDVYQWQLKDRKVEFYHGLKNN